MDEEVLFIGNTRQLRARYWGEFNTPIASIRNYRSGGASVEGAHGANELGHQPDARLGGNNMFSSGASWAEDEAGALPDLRWRRFDWTLSGNLC